MNKRKGVSLLAIVISVAIILAISGTAIFEYRQIVIKARKRELATDFYLMSKAIKDYEFINSKLPVTDKITISIPVGYEAQFKDEPDLDGDGRIELKYVDYNKLNTEELVRGMQKNGTDFRYAMSEWTDRLYYLKGENIEGNIYYTLTNDLSELLDVSNVK